MKNIKTFEGFWDFLKDKNPIKKTLHYQELFVIKQKVKAQCENLAIENYTINNDGTVDVNGNLNIYLVLDRIKKDERNAFQISHQYTPSWRSYRRKYFFQGYCGTCGWP